MKKATVFLLLVCLAALLVGCGGQKETVDDGAQSKTQAATDVKEEAVPGAASETAADSGAAEETPAQQGGAAKADTGSSAEDAKPAAGVAPAQGAGASAPSKAGAAGGGASDSAGSGSPKPAGNSPSAPAGSGTDAAGTPALQPEEKVFDMDYWLAYAKDYAAGIGLRLDENATDSWDTPIRCSSKTEDVLAAYIRDDLTYYKNEEGCTAVWIWAEQVGDGQYELFIGRG